jgi:hypothetical protein
MNVKKFHPEIRLKKLLSVPGGVKAGDALQRAESNIEALRPAGLAAIEKKVAEIAAADPSNDLFLYQRSNELISDAGTLGLTELEAVARSFCDLMSREGDISQAEVAVHRNAMRALMTPELAGDADARAAVVVGLKKLSARA